MIDYGKYGITFQPFINKLDKHYTDEPSQFYIDIKERPYMVLIGIVGMAFKSADELIQTRHYAAPDSRERCLYAVYHILATNEAYGNTRMKDSELARQVNNLCQEAMGHIVDIVKNDGGIYYEPASHWVSKRGTYNSEVNIAEHVKHRLANPVKLDVNVNKYRHNVDFELTDEQIAALQMVADNSVCMVNGAAGCVDCDTEFFAGYGWKRIADYAPGDKVLQYNEDGTATLVEPLAYIKRPCDGLWHFETHRGINQTVCDDHRIIYETRNGILKECNIHQLMDMHLPNNKSFQGKFLTTFDYVGRGISLNEWQIRLMVAVIADSTMLGRGAYCRFNIKKERKKERLIWLINKCGIKYTRTDRGDGYSQIHTHAPRREKEFTDFWYDCSKEQMQIILDEVKYWDGCVRKTSYGTEYTTFSTSIKKSADFIQFAASSCGIRASISTFDRRGEIKVVSGKEYVRKSFMYVVYFSSRTKVGLCAYNRQKCKKTPIEKVNTLDGYKYCFTVPSHMLILRRGDCIFVTGNCGKSQVTKEIVNMIEDSNKSYVLLAPTGISARVLRHYTGRPASTIHMFLTGPYSPDYVLIDEISMVGVHLLSSLLSAIGHRPNLIFIGDSAQLASISCGSIIRDIIESNAVPRVILSKIFRYNTSGIVTIATDVRHGDSTNLIKQFDDYQFIPTSDDPIGQTVSIYDNLMQQGYSQDDILMLCPFNKHIGADEINRRISNKHNLSPKVRKNSDIKLNDRVINIKNSYGPTDEDFVANGDIGWLKSKRYDRADRANHFLVDFENGRHEVKSLANLKLAYCISCHKSQGSSSKIVVVLIDKSHDFMVNKNLLYTAITRARDGLIIVGDLDTIKQGLSIASNEIRDTWLKELLKEDKAND